MITRYAIQLESCNPLVDVFVAEHPVEWRTTELSAAKTWKTRAGAGRFFSGRSGLGGKVIVVRLGLKSGKPCGVISA